MFVESLLESGHAHPLGRGWATTLSITLQGLLLAALVALPLFRPDRLPLEMKSISSPIAFGVSSPTPPNPDRHAPNPLVRHEARLIFTARPTQAPIQPSDAAEPGPYVPGAIPGRPDGVPGVLDTLIPRNPPVVHVRPAPEPVRRVSVAAPGKITHQVQPVYPTPAKNAHIEGVVVLHAIIDREGRITGLQAVSGHPFLLEAATSAVRQWRYRPYLLNGQPVEVETQITVNFKLAR